MTKANGSFAGAPLVRDLHKALLDLYDPAKLARSPLIDLFSIGQQSDPPAALRRILSQAIEALKPGAEVPAQAEAWLFHEVLLHRYVQQIPQTEIATSLGFSKRQLQRHEASALQALANYLWSHYGLELRQPLPTAPDAATGATPSSAGGHGELEWVSKSFSREAVNITEIVQGAVRSIAPLLDAAHVRIDSALPPNLPRLAVHTITMRQVVVSLMSTAAQRVPGGRVQVRAESRPAQVAVHIRAVRGRGAPRQPGAEDNESLAMARQLVAVSGGALELATEQDDDILFGATLLLPVAQQLGVLVIDDNVDTLQLFQRYLQGTRYAFVGAQDPEQALALARDLAPKAILLDVMLPGMDGWEVLGRLREHPVTRGLPVIVCSILPSERLALTLGASAFLRKPASREALLKILDQTLNVP